MLTGQQTIQRLSEVLQQVEAVGYLHRVGRGLACALGKGSTPIATDDGYVVSGVLLQPARQRGRLAVRQEIEDAVLLKIHQDRPIALPAPEGKIVHAQCSQLWAIWSAPGRTARRTRRSNAFRLAPVTASRKRQMSRRPACPPSAKPTASRRCRRAGVRRW